MGVKTLKMPFRILSTGIGFSKPISASNKTRTGIFKQNIYQLLARYTEILFRFINIEHVLYKSGGDFSGHKNISKVRKELKFSGKENIWHRLAE